MFTAKHIDELKLTDTERFVAKQLPKDNVDDNFTFVYEKYTTNDQLKKIIDSYPENNRSFYEGINGTKQIRGYWDLDAYPRHFANLNEATYVFDRILAVIRRSLFYYYNKLPLLAVYDSSKEGVKYSWHIITQDVSFPNMDELKAFSYMVKYALDENVAEILDMNVYKSTQLFRLEGCHKLNDDRVKRFLKLVPKSTKKVIFSDSLITYSDNTGVLSIILSDQKKKTKNNYLELNQDELKADLTKIAVKWYKSQGLTWKHTPRELYGNWLWYKRVGVEKCFICGTEDKKVTHTRDNTIIVEYMYDGNVFLRCDRDPNKHILIGKLTKGRQKKLKANEYWINLLTRDEKKQLTLFDNLPSDRKLIYSENKMRKYETANTLCIKAEMGLGKTVQLIDMINSETYGTIVMISFRRTFTTEMCRRFRGFHSYENLPYKIDLIKYPKIIIQLESLHRINNNTLPNIVGKKLVIIDESESIIGQFDNRQKNIRLSFAMFSWLMENASHVVAMDANLSDRSFNILNKYRPNTIFYHNNEWKNKTDYTCYVSRDKKIWVNKLLTDIKSYKIAIATNSCEQAKILYKLIQSVTDKKTLLLTSKTDETVKYNIFKDVNKTLIEYDYIIYTPTLTAGVSFEVVHFDKLYGYFTDDSCDGYTCDQMMGRIRTFSQKEYNIYLKGIRKILPTKIIDVKNTLIEDREILSRDLQTLPECDVKIDEFGRYVYRSDNYMELWLENVSVKNKFRNKFVELMVSMFKNKGCKMIPMEIIKLPKELDADIEERLKRFKKEITEQEAETLAGAIIIHNPNTGNIMDQMENATTVEEKLCVIKINLGKFYNIPLDYIDLITKEFILTYNNPLIKNQYINTNLIRTKGLNYLVNRQANVVSEEDTLNELQSKNRYLENKYALDLLTACGFTSIDDKQKIHKSVLETNLNASGLFTKEMIIKYNKFYEHRKCNRYEPLTSLRQRIGVVSSLIKNVYGIDVKIMSSCNDGIDVDTGHKKGELYIIYVNDALEKLGDLLKEKGL